MRLTGVRNVLATVSAVALLTAASGAMAQTADQLLVQMLVENGKLTKAQADRINAAPPDQQVSVLAQMLRDKGDLTDQQVQRINRAPRSVVVAAPGPGVPPLIAAAAPRPDESPFAFHIGKVNIQVGGFIDAEMYIRGSNTTNGPGTNFGQIPFSNTVQGHLGDIHLTGQMTRFSLKGTTNFWGNDLTAYAEMDFNGNDAANVNVNASSHTPRLRLAYVNLMRGPFELQAGQLWSWVTPNRVGLSADPNDVFTTYNLDANYSVGLNWTRQGAIRAAWHFNPNLVAGISLENPDQYIGTGEVVFPFLFNAQLGPQFDASNNSGAPALAPDVIPKVAFDGNPMGMHFHAEALGLFRTYRTAVIGLTPTFDKHTLVTKAGGVNANLEVLPGFTLVGGGMYGEGIGRYAGALGPDVVVDPTGNPVPVTGVSALVGAEWHVTPNDLLAAYGGIAFFHSNFFVDPTNPVPGRFAGFGAPNSPNTANKNIQEISVDYMHRIWNDPQYGSLQAGAQYSAVVRRPWFVAPGAPKDAIVHMGFVNLRYNLPTPVPAPAPPPPPP